MTLVWMFLAVIGMLFVTKVIEDHFGEEEKYDQLLKIEEPRRGLFTVAGGKRKAENDLR